MFDIINIIFLVIILAISIWLHEYAHAISSYNLWDPTPKLQNRLTPNPIAHIDPIGFLMIFLIHFWWWKPVIVNPSYYKNPLRDELIVSLAWPFTNLLLAIFWIIILSIYAKFWLWVEHQVYLLKYLDAFSSQYMILRFWLMFSVINVWLAIFNLLPLPPLDWYRLIKFFIPRLWFWMERNTLIILPIFLFVLIFFWWFIWYLSSSVSWYILYFISNLFF